MASIYQYRRPQAVDSPRHSKSDLEQGDNSKLHKLDMTSHPILSPEQQPEAEGEKDKETREKQRTNRKKSQNQTYRHCDSYVLPPHLACHFDAWRGSLTAAMIVTGVLVSLNTLLLTLELVFPYQTHEPRSATAARCFSWIGILSSLAVTAACVFMLNNMSNLTLLAKATCARNAMIYISTVARNPLASGPSTAIPLSLSSAERPHRSPDSQDNCIKQLALLRAYNDPERLSTEEAQERYAEAVNEFVRLWEPKGEASVLRQFGLENCWWWHHLIYLWMLPASIMCVAVQVELYLWNRDSRWNAGFHLPFLLLLFTFVIGYAPRVPSQPDMVQVLATSEP